MGSKCRRQKKPRKNRGGERLQEWKILKEFNCVEPTREDVTSVTEEFTEGHKDNITEEVNQLIVESDPSTDDHIQLDYLEGRRIVDISFFFDQLKSLSNHAPQFSCTLNNLSVKSEIVRGLCSGFMFVCNMCGYSKVVWTDPKCDTAMDINAAAVAGSISTGGGFTNLTKVLGAMNIRCMGHSTYEKYEGIISKGWEDSALEEMNLAAQEEASIARERNSVDTDGVPLLTVVADGSWSKRSYRCNFNSLSGVVSTRHFTTRHYLLEFRGGGLEYRPRGSPVNTR